MIKVFAKDLLELFERPFLAFWLVAVPMSFLLVADNISVSPPPVATLVGAHSDNAKPPVSRVRSLLGELSGIDVLHTVWDGTDPAAKLTGHRARMAVAWNEQWRVYVRPDGSADRARLKTLAYQIVVSIEREMPWQVAEDEIIGMKRKFGESDAANAYTIIDLGSPAVERSGDLISAMIALAVAFLPFLIACSSMAREWEHGTLQTLLVVPGISWWGVVVGKICLALFVTAVVFACMTIVSFSYFGIPPRFDFLAMLLFQMPAMAASAFLGMAASSILKAQFSAYFVSVLYAFCLIFLTGMIFPISESAELLQLVSKSLPLTHSLAAMTQWLLHGVPAYHYSDDAYALLILCAGAFVVMVASATLARRRV